MEPAFLREAADLAEKGVPCAIATVVEAHGSVPGKVGATMLITADGTSRGTVGGAGLEEKTRQLAREALAIGRGGVHTFDLARWKDGGLDSVCGGTVTVSIHVIHALPHLLLVGGGHCAVALAEVAKPLGWSISVVDSRAGYAERERFPTARAAVTATPAEFIENCEDLSAYSHIYLLGHSHHEDGDALIAVLERGYSGIIGAIGSRAKMHAFQTRASERGLPDDAFARVRCPIGVDVGAQTPPEIAIAVAAEVIRDLHAPPPETAGARRERAPQTESRGTP